MAAAAAGDVEIVTRVVVREHGQPAPPHRASQPRPAEPRSLADEMRAMGLM